MVVPDSSGVVPEPDNGRPTGLTESSDPVCEEAEERGHDLAGVELEEVRKLQELVRRLEVQNETLRNRGAKIVIPRGANSNLSAADNINKRLTCDQVRVGHRGEPGSTDCKLSPPQDNNSSGEDMSPLPVISRLEEEEEDRVEEEDLGPCGSFLSLTCRNSSERSQGQSQTPESPSQESYESETLTESDSGVDQTALDEVDVLDLEDECLEVEDEDSW